MLKAMPEDLAEAIDKVAELRAARASHRADKEPEQLLSAPGCPEGCSRCSRACAVTTIILKWWERELATLVAADAGLILIREAGTC